MTRRRAGLACESCVWQPDRADRDLLDAHERFTYDDTTGIQRLVPLLSLCAACPRGTHLRYATLTGQPEPPPPHPQYLPRLTPPPTPTHLNDAPTPPAPRTPS